VWFLVLPRGTPVGASGASNRIGDIGARTAMNYARLDQLWKGLPHKSQEASRAEKRDNGEMPQAGKHLMMSDAKDTIKRAVGTHAALVRHWSSTRRSMCSVVDAC